MAERTALRDLSRISFPYVEHSVGAVSLLGMRLLLAVCQAKGRIALMDRSEKTCRHRGPNVYKGTNKPL